MTDIMEQAAIELDRQHRERDAQELREAVFRVEHNQQMAATGQQMANSVTRHIKRQEQEQAEHRECVRAANAEVERTTEAYENARRRLADIKAALDAAMYAGDGARITRLTMQISTARKTEADAATVMDTARDKLAHLPAF